MAIEVAQSAEVSMDYKKILDEVLAREKVIKKEWLDKTKDTYETYDGGKADSTPFNILYSNTEILVPNLFSAAPKPVVRRRFGERRADGATRAAERMAEYCMDTNLPGYPDFVDAIESCVLDAALPGQGQSRVRLVDSTAVIDYVPHDMFVWAYAKRWEDTPWIAYRYDKTIADTVREFDVAPEVAEKFVRPTGNGTESNTDKGPPTIEVYECWNKATREVLFLTPSHPDSCIKKVDDPLELKGFFPSGKPLRLLATPVSTMPKSLYGLYKKQAEELNEITRRITKVSKAIQVRGFYDGGIAEMAQLFDDSDTENRMVAVTNPGGMNRDGGIDKHIWLIPIEKLVVVLQQLFTIRDGIKNTIYEILGIGDILRGVSAASETASAQEIKDKWGTLRIKKSREKVSAFVRVQIRLLVEVSAKHVDEQIWGKVTGLPFISSIEAQVLAASPPPMPMPGMPPQGPPPKPPENWGSILGLLRDDLTRSYTIDIETNSTVDGDATTEKSELTEFMTAFAQTTQSLGPLAAGSQEGFELSKAILTEVFKRFRLGGDILSLLDAMKPPPKPESPEAVKMKEEAQKLMEQAQSKDEQATGAMDSARAAFEQQKQQLDQITEQLRSERKNLDDMGMKLREKALELDTKEASLDMQIREAEIAVGKREVAVDAKIKDTTVALKSADTMGRAKEMVQAKDREVAAKPPPAPPAADPALAKLVEAMSTQAAAVAELVKVMGRPVKITKTGPNSYTKE